MVVTSASPVLSPSPVSPTSNRSSSIGLVLSPDTNDLPVPSEEPPRLELEPQRRTYSEKKESFCEVLAQIKELHERLREIYEADLAQPSMTEPPLSRASSGRSLSGRSPSPRGARDRTWSLNATSASTLREKTPMGLRPSVSWKRAVSTPGQVTFMNAAQLVDSRLSSKESKAAQLVDSSRFTSTESKGRVSSQLANQAMMAKNDMEEEIRLESDNELEFQIAEEWDMDNEELFELKKSDMTVTNQRTDTPLDAINAVRKRVSNASKPVPVPWTQRCIIHPESSAKVSWDCLAILAILFDICLGPLNVYNLDEQSALLFEVMHWFASGFWLLDIPVSFRTAVYVNDLLHFQPGVIAKTYLTSWFSFDLLMLLPDIIHILQLDRLWSPAGSSAGMLRIIRVQRLLRVVGFFRLLRMDRLAPLRKRFELLLPVPSENLRVLFPILRSFFALLLAIHLLASMWWVAGSAENGWVLVEELYEAPFGEQYMRSVEWAVSRLPASSLRNNVELATPAERWLAISATFIALVSSSLFVGVLTNVLADLTQRRKKMNQILESVRKYCSDSHLPFTYTMKVRRFVEREHHRRSMHGHMEFLQTLPDGMVSELFHEARSRTLTRSHPFLKQIGKGNRCMEIDLCMKAVTELYLLENDTLFDSNQRSKGMYILATGKFVYAPREAKPGSAGRNWMKLLKLSSWGTQRMVRPSNSFVSDGDGAQVMTVNLRADDYLSEQGLWIKGWRHCGRLGTSCEQSRALLLSKQGLHAVLREHSDVLATVVVYSRFFVDTMNAMPAMSDLPLEMDQTGGINRIFKFKLESPEFETVLP